MYQLPETELDAAIRRGYAAIDGAQQHVLLAHVPPQGMKVDRTFFWVHAGSTAVRAFVDQVQPTLVFCGHIHEGRGIELSGKTTIVNCGFGGGGHYAMAQLAGHDVQVVLRSVD
jgi:Icc-related predicted phosphoesterase